MEYSKGLSGETIENLELKRETSELLGATHVMSPNVTIALDFDGTVVKHHYPRIGEDIPHCVSIMKEYTDRYGVGWILDTMRAGDELDEAVQWFEERGVTLYGIGKDPTQHTWTESTKCYAPLSIDDRNVGTPLIYEAGERPYVDWEAIDKILRPKLEKLCRN